MGEADTVMNGAGWDVMKGGSGAAMELVFDGVVVSESGKFLIQDVYGTAKSGQLMAIMGPSGAGKTTLLNALAGRTPIESGTITLNGTTLNKTLQQKMCYVPQDGIFLPNLTLRETLTFTTILRLPDTMSFEKKMNRMENLIDELDIRNCLGTLVGDAWTKGLSGGEKKRANIACELITDPMMILMDEPTSGLDYSAALSLVKTLQSYAHHHNKTIVTTIHQPSSQIFQQFHQLLLLCDGQVAYSGEVAKVAQFFADIGLPIEPLYNPADFLLEKLMGSEDNKMKIIKETRKLHYGESWEMQGVPSYEGLKEELQSNTAPKKSLSLRLQGFLHFWKNRRQHKMPDADDIDPGSVHLLDWEITASTESKWPTGFFTQYQQLSIRTFRNSRARILSRFKLVEGAVLCVLVSLIWFQLPRVEETLRDRMGVIFFITIHWGFTPLFDAVSSFPMERLVIRKELSAGWYCLSAYYLAKVSNELLLTLFKSTIFLIVVYTSVGLHGSLVFPVFVIVLDAIAGQSIGLFLGISCMDVQRALTLATIVMMSIMLLGGFYTRTLPVWLDWLKYLSFLHYTFHCMLVLEFSGAPPFRCAASRNTSQFLDCLTPNATHVSSERIMEFYGITWTFTQYFTPILLFIFIFWTAGYLLLKFVHHPQ